MMIFLFIFGAMFGFVGIGLFIESIISGDYGMAAMATVPGLIGVICMSIPGRGVVNRVRGFFVAKRGQRGVGYFENQVSGGSKENVRYRINFSFADGDDIPHIIKTLRTYSWSQAEQLRSLGSFNIIHHKGLAVIDLRNPHVKKEVLVQDVPVCRSCGRPVRNPGMGENCHYCGSPT